MTPIATIELVLADTDWNHMGGGAWFLMGLGMVIFWALMIFGVVWIVRTLSAGDRERFRREPSALEVLDRSLADGTISADEYQERRKLLTGSSRDR